MNGEQQIRITADGFEWVGDNPVAQAYGAARRRRASRIEPCHPLLRVPFRALRAITPDSSRIADWTRRWPCQWRVRILGGPTFGHFRERQAAIQEEIRWLEQHR